MRLEVSDLREHEHWVPLVAGWHHSEWLRQQREQGKESVDKQLNEQKLLEREQVLARHLADAPLPTTYIAHRGDSPVGTVSLVYYRFTSEQKSTEWLTNLYVLPEYRCRGIASALLNKALVKAQDLKIRRLFLYTNDQVEFYKKRQWCLRGKGVVQGQDVDIMDFILKPIDAG